MKSNTTYKLLFIYVFIVCCAFLSCQSKNTAESKQADNVQNDSHIPTDSINPKQNDSSEKNSKANNYNYAVHTTDKYKAVEVETDSTYIYKFYNKNDSVIGEYNIWAQNPVDLVHFEKMDPTPGDLPMRYIVPKLSREELKGKIPPDLYRSLDTNSLVGRIDILPRFGKLGNHYSAFLYDVRAQLGAREEFNSLGSMGAVQILDNKGQVMKTITYQNSVGPETTVTQDGNLLMYKSSATGNVTGGCINVYDLTKDRVVYKYCADDEDQIVHVGSQNGFVLGAKIEIFPSKHFILVSAHSKDNAVYIKNINQKRTKYKYKYFQNGILLTDRQTDKIDTLLYQQDFDKIKL